MKFEYSQDPVTGKWTIHDVPIFATVKKGEHPKATRTIDRAWLVAALAFAQTRAREGYEYRANVNHHFSGGSVEPVGYFRHTRVGPIEVGGVKKDAIFADVFDLSDEVMARFSNSELPSRSAEIFTPDGKPDIDILSFLPTMPPFHKLPVTTARTLFTRQNSGDQTPALVAQDGPVSMFECDGSTVAVFSEVKPTMKGIICSSSNGLKFVATDGVETVLEEGLSFSANGSDFEVESITIETTELDAANERIAELEGEVAAFKAKPASEGSISVAAFGALRGEVAALKSVANEDKLVTAARKRLTDAGFDVNEEVETDIASFAALGEDTLDKYLASFEKHAAKEPPATLEDAVGNGHLPQDNETVATFVAQTPERADEIRDIAMEHESLASRGMKCSLESFIKDRLVS